MERINTSSENSFAKVATVQRNSPELTYGFLGVVGGETHGRLQETGVVVAKDGRIAAAVRGPNYIPTKSGFGGRQREVFVEESLAVPDRKPDLSKQILNALTTGVELKTIADVFNGALLIGAETESVRYRQNGRVCVDSLHSSVELTKGQHEDAHDPVSGPNEYLRMKSRYVLEILSKAPHTETSAPLTGEAVVQKLNDEGELGPYIYIVQTILLNSLNREHDQEAWYMWDQIAQKEGFQNMEELFRVNQTLAPWFMNALHMSVGLAHFKVDGQNRIRAEQLVGTGDLVCSELGAVAGLITASTPVIYGVEPVLGGTKIRDARLEGRHLLPTSGPNSEPIVTVDNLLARIVENIVEQRSHTIARAGYTSQFNGSRVAAMHSQARLRSEVGFGKSANATSGRVEVTGIGATPSLLDQAGSLGYVQLLHVLALEADSKGIPAIEHADDLGLSSGTSFKVRELNREFNRKNDTHASVQRVLNEASALVLYMRERYPSLNESCHYAETALRRLQSSPADGLSEYLQHPSGSFADVLRNEYNLLGNDPDALVASVHNFQQEQAQLIQKII